MPCAVVHFLLLERSLVCLAFTFKPNQTEVWRTRGQRSISIHTSPTKPEYLGRRTRVGLKWTERAWCERCSLDSETRSWSLVIFCSNSSFLESSDILLSSRFKIFSNQSALESLALIPLQAPLKTMLQMSVVPLINNWTKRGVRIPLADGMDFIEEVVEYHNGFIVIGANLHFSKGLREMMAGSSDIQPTASTAV